MTSAASSRQTRGVNHASLMLALRDYLRVRGAWELKVAGGAYQKPGAPDFVCCIKGRFLACEGKTGSATLTPAQVREKRAIEHSGGLYVVAHTVDDLESALLDAGLIDSPALLGFRR